MGLVTLLLIIAFTALSLSKSLDKKPEPLTRLVDKVTLHIDNIAKWGALYGAAAAVLSLAMHFSSTGMLVRVAANILIVMMALPFIYVKLKEKYQQKINPVILTEADNFIAWLTKNEKYISYAGAACGILLFAILFR